MITVLTALGRWGLGVTQAPTETDVCVDRPSQGHDDAQPQQQGAPVPVHLPEVALRELLPSLHE